MFKKIIKWTAIVLGAIIVIVAIVAISLMASTSKRMNKTWDIQPAAIPLPTDSASIARGGQLAHVLCMDCHGEGFAGKVLLDDPSIGKIDAHNLTRGKGGIGSKYTDVDWVRAIRHGINPEGRALFVMPAKEYHHMSETDLAEVIAYLKTIPPVDKEWLEKPAMKTPAKLLAALGAFGDFLNAEVIDHKAGYEIAPVEAPTSEYGEYLVDIFGCRHCHGLQMNGGPGSVPHSPLAPNLTAGGHLANWTDEDFHKALRTGWTPEGKQLSDYYMPWKATQHMTDLELTAIYKYLKSLPKLETAEK